MKQRDYNTGDTCTVIAQAQSGYRFVNWTENGEVVSTNARYSFTVTESRDLIANFEQETVPSYTITVTATPSDGGTVTGGGSYTRGSSCTLTATPNEGYNFVRWTKGSTELSTNPTYTFTVTANGTYKANFAADVVNYTIRTESEPSDGGTTTGDGVYEAGSTCTLTATANNGYTFVEWQDGTTHDRVSTNSEYTFMVEDDKTLIAKFEVTTPRYTVTTNVVYDGDSTIDLDGTAGTITGLNNPYESGTTCTLTATAENGFRFTGWEEIHAEHPDPTISFTVTNNITRTAHFSPEHDLTVSVFGTGGGARGIYYGNNRYKLMAQADSGYIFGGWYSDGLSSETPLSMDEEWSFDIESEFPVRIPTGIVAKFTQQ